MRRVVSLYLPTWPTDRIRRKFGDPPRDKPLVTVHAVGSRRVVHAACQTAQKLGIYAGMVLAQAQAMVPNLHTIDAKPEEDDASLRSLAQWAIGYSPIVGLDLPDGLWIDVFGTTHLFGGEEALLRDLINRLDGQGIAAKGAIADVPGAAWAVARCGLGGIVPSGRADDTIRSLHVRALRLSADKLDTLHRLGIERIGQLENLPRAPMVRRFGQDVALRLDQAMGHIFEPINPIIPKDLPVVSTVFAEPIGHLDDLKRVVLHLCETLCKQLELRSEGVRRLDLMVRRIDQQGACLRFGTARATRAPVHLAKLFSERLETIDPGFGIEEIALLASKVEPLAEQQTETHGMTESDDSDFDMGELIDRLAVKVGGSNIYRISPVQSLVPERMVRKIPALAPPTGADWPQSLPHPTRLLDPPEEVVAMALLPDHPPAFFVWRKIRHKVIKADGPERITMEWWNGNQGSIIRDYYRIEAEHGSRFWIFRDAPASEGGRWWLHGLFS
ncbi:DUF6504 family protein [Microvirga puerhi]|uniref:DNA-directed DNA polymerase n=1 Tax=Microvirga puerhi TaxID=2876078 RepID=A0ABS7VJI1_9HYPH|nr:DUF6504 family protein [Microvirga puerhi]MBZ6075128.1 DNA polymerase Y family protein [Microvirga puerhi]